MKPREDAIGIVFALGAATAYGVNAVVVKEGIQRYGVVLPGLAVAIVVGMLAISPMAMRSRPRARIPASAYGYILLSGLCAACGIGSYFLALSMLPVSVVVPISSVYPLVTLALARVMLGNTDPVTWRTVAGALCVCVGVAVVALNRAP